MTQHFEKVHYRASEAAIYLGIGKSTFWRWTRNGTLPKGTKLSAKVTVWPKEALDKFVEERSQGAGYAGE